MATIHMGDERMWITDDFKDAIIETAAQLRKVGGKSEAHELLWGGLEQIVEERSLLITDETLAQAMGDMAKAGECWQQQEQLAAQSNELAQQLKK